LSFYRDAGERFAREREQGLRYGTLMAQRPARPGRADENELTHVFMPFAGTVGYNPAAYLPYISWQVSPMRSGSSFRRASW
jgi:hypothetical protein